MFTCYYRKVNTLFLVCYLLQFIKKKLLVCMVNVQWLAFHAFWKVQEKRVGEWDAVINNKFCPEIWTVWSGKSQIHFALICDFTKPSFLEKNLKSKFHKRLAGLDWSNMFGRFAKRLIWCWSGGWGPGRSTHKTCDSWWVLWNFLH